MRRLLAALAVLVPSTGALIGWVPPAAAQAERDGDARVVAPEDTSEALERGDTATPFVLALPADASCPGDTLNDDYRVQTFIVPGGDGPVPARFEPTKPVGEGSWALYGVDTRPYVQEPTEPNAARGEPGRIGGLRAMNFAVFPEGTLPDSEYRIGVACTYRLDTERYWDIAIEITNSDDRPPVLRWRVAGAAEQASGPGSGPVAYLVGGAAVAAAAAVFLRRSAKRDAAGGNHERPQKETVR